jgi:rhodanese-related sulfurtransferase
MIVVNCAGRTRSIIGAQSLINAGLANKVVALRNGTMGWQLAGQRCETGKDDKAPQVSTAGLARAKAAAARVSAHFGVTHVDLVTVQRWREEADTRSLYVLDVRDPTEYAAGHVAGAISAPGGQLVQATDQYVGTLGARIVVVDDLEVRAVMTASWLIQMGWKDVFVLVEKGNETGWPTPPLLGYEEQPEIQIDVGSLERLLAEDAATVVDVSLSRAYRKGHIAGAWFAIRSRLEKALAAIPQRGTLVLTSEDGILAGLAAGEAKSSSRAPVRCLKGGNAAWVNAGHPLEQGETHMADDPVDIWLKPYERASGTTAAMSEYLAWEVDLLERIARDGTCRFYL